MTETVDPTRAQRILRAIGPYPIRPAVLGSAMGILVVLVLLAPNRQYWWQSDEPLPAVIQGLIVGVIIAFWAVLGRAWQRRRGVHWGAYLACMAVMGTTVPLVRAFYPDAPDLPSGDLGPIPPYVRSITTLLLINMFIGITTRRLQDQVDATQEALDIAREQQVQILTSDEEARRQISSLLHDRVQAELIAVCLELRGIAQGLSVDDRAEVDPLIQRLETLRSLDVRNAARSLSPNLDEVDLQTALEDLAMPYEATLLVTVDVDQVIDQQRQELGLSMLLACYRIVEQALLNVAAHARASQVQIQVTCHDDIVRVVVVDDGVGLPDDAPRGLGWTLVTTWVRAMHGQWWCRRRVGQPGTELTAELTVGARVEV